jgi:hypothetical protein
MGTKNNLHAFQRMVKYVKWMMFGTYCIRCGKKLSTNNDAVYVNENGYQQFLYFKCPCCGEKIEVGKI